jgi:hypothetical protein
MKVFSELIFVSAWHLNVKTSISIVMFAKSYYSVMDPDQCIIVLEEQLLSGCRSPLCTHKYCRSNPNFSLPPDSDAETLAATLAADPANVCPNMPLIYADGAIIELAASFDDFRQQFCSKMLTDDAWASFPNYLKPKHFPYLFFDFTDQLPDSELDIILSDFYDSSINYYRLLLPHASTFRDLARETVRAAGSVSRMHVASLLTFWAFEALMRHQHFNGIVLPVLTSIVQLPDELKRVVADTFLKLPKFHERVIGTLETILSIFCDKSPECVLFFGTNGLNVLLKVIHLFLSKNYARSQPLPFSVLATDSFTRCFSARVEAAGINVGIEDRLSGQVPDFFQWHPYLFTLEFKQEVSGVAPITRALEIVVDRVNLVRDGSAQLKSAKPDALSGRLSVGFRNETSQDNGGPSREFLTTFATEVFKPDYRLFELVNKDQYSWFCPLPLAPSGADESVGEYELLGRVVGIAITNQIPLPVRLPLVLYKKLTRKLIGSLEELAEIQPEIAESLVTMRVFSEDEMDGLGLTFSTIVPVQGVNYDVELIENGANVPVTKANIEEYITKVIEWELIGAVNRQFTAFAAGFSRVCSAPIYQFFSFDELDALVSGRDIENWAELKREAGYSDGYTAKNVTVQLFWRIFEEYDQNSKKRLFKFITGSEKVPMAGLAQVQVIIQRSTDVTRAPVAHTCTNTLVLPDYQNEEVMRRMLDLCVKFCDGFGVA